MEQTTRRYPHRSRRNGKPDTRSLRQQIMALETRSNLTVQSLKIACEELAGLEADLERFLSHYYEQVGGYFEQLEAIDRELTDYKNPLKRRLARFAQAKRPSEEVMPLRQNQAIERDMKSLYRDMAKEFHPDLPAGDQAVAEMKEDAIRVLNDAYARKNLGELWKIKCEVEARKDKGRLPAEKKLDRLSERVEQLQRALQEVEGRRATLEQSPAFALMQRAFQMRLCGQDFIEAVLRDVKGQIERKRQELVTLKLRERFLNAGSAEIAANKASPEAISSHQS